MRRVKGIALWSLGLLLLSAAGLAVFLATAGDGFYRWAAVQVLEGALDRQVHVEGTFSFDVGLAPTLIVTEVSIENAPWAEKKEMARIKRAEVQIALRPLFAGIVRIHRLVISDLTLNLERGPDGTGNWEVAKPSSGDPETAAQEDLFIPLFEHISLKNVAVTYRDRQGGRDTVLLLDSLEMKKIAGETSSAIRGKGSLNQRHFSIKGRFGSVEKALAAAAPFPFELTLNSVGLVAELTGTAKNLPRGEGFDIAFSARAPSIGRVLQTLGSDLALDGRAKASARLRGDLESLSVEDLAVEIVDGSGQELRVEGSLSDLLNGKGLDLRFTAELGPKALQQLYDPPQNLREILIGAELLDLGGRITGDLEAPAFEDLHARLELGSGAYLSLRGRLALALSEEGTKLTALEASTILSLPDPTLLQKALGARLPDMGAIHAISELALEDDWIRLRALEVKATSFGAMQLSAKGRLARLSGKGLEFAFAPLIDIMASLKQSRPLVAFLARLSKEAKTPSRNRVDSPPSKPSDPKPSGAPSSPLMKKAPRGSGDNLVLSIQQGLRSAGLDPGPLDGLMGPRARKAIEAYQAKHGLAVNGRASRDLLQHLQRQAGIGRREPAPETADTRSPDAKFEDTLPELGPVRASVRLSRSKGAYRLDDLRLTLGTKDVLWVEASGTLGILRPGRDAPLEGLALTVKVALPSSKTLPQVFPPDLPEFRKLRARFDVQGSLEALSIAGARIEAEGPNGLTGTASGRIARLSLLPVLAIKDLAFDLEAQSPSTKSIFQLFGLSLPELGPVRARAILKDRGDLFALTAIDVSAGSADRPAAHATGQIGDLLAMKKIELSGDFQIATARLLGLDAPVEKSALGRVHGQFSLSDADGSIGIEVLSAEVKNTKLLSLSVKGLFDDIEQKDELRFEVALKVPEVFELARELGFTTNLKGSLSFMGQVSGSDERFQSEGKFRLGKTDLTGTLSGSLVGERPVLRAKLYSPAFHLADFGLLPNTDTPESAAKKEGKDEKPVRKRLFSEKPISFGALKDFNLDFDMRLDKVVGVHLKINTIKAELDIVDGLLKVDLLILNFVGGHIEIRLIADARTKVPKVSLDIIADDIDLGDFLAQAETDAPLDGELDMIVHLKAAGLSPRTLAASLEGQLDLALAQGHVRTGLLDLAVTNAIGWLFSRSARTGYSELNCLVMRFDVQKGVGKLVTLLLDTTNVRAEGSGNIDLRDEIVGIDVNPRAKRRRIIAISTPFRIEGPLASPSVNVSTMGAATGMIGKTLAAPINFLGSLLPFGSGRGKDADNTCYHLEDRKRPLKEGNKSN